MKCTLLIACTLLFALSTSTQLAAQLTDFRYFGDEFGSMYFDRADTLSGGRTLYRSVQANGFVLARPDGRLQHQFCAPQSSTGPAAFEYENEIVVLELAFPDRNNEPAGLFILRADTTSDFAFLGGGQRFPGVTYDFGRRQQWFRLNDTIVAKPLQQPTGALLLVNLRTKAANLQTVTTVAASLSFHHRDTVFFVEQVEGTYGQPINRAWVYGTASAVVIDLSSRIRGLATYRFIEADPFVNGSNDGLPVIEGPRGNTFATIACDLKTGALVELVTSGLPLTEVYRYAPGAYVSIDSELDRSTGQFSSRIFRYLPGTAPELLTTVDDFPDVFPVASGLRRDSLNVIRHGAGSNQEIIVERYAQDGTVASSVLFDLPTRAYGAPLTVVTSAPAPEVLFNNSLRRYRISDRTLYAAGLPAPFAAKDFTAPERNGALSVLTYDREDRINTERTVFRRDAAGNFYELGFVRGGSSEFSLIRNDTSGRVLRITTSTGLRAWTILGPNPDGSGGLYVSLASGSLNAFANSNIVGLALAGEMQDFLLLRSAATANTFEEVLYTIDRATGSVDYRSEPSPVQYGDFRRDFVRPNRPEEGIGVIVVQAPAFSQARPNTAELAVIATRYTLASTTPTSFSIPLSDFYQSGVQPSQDPGSQALVACGSDIAFDNRAVTCRLIDLVGDALQQVTIPVNLPVNHLPTVAIYRDRTLTLAGTREAKLFEPTSWLTSIATPGITIPSSLAEPLATIPLQLYPNPAPRSSALTITLPGASSSAASTLRVFDVLGREVLAQPVSAGTKTLQLPLTTLTAGSYQMVIGHARATAIVIE